MDRLGLFGPFIIRFVETWEKKVLRSQDPVTRVNTGVTGLCNVSQHSVELGLGALQARPLTWGYRLSLHFATNRQMPDRIGNMDNGCSVASASKIWANNESPRGDRRRRTHSVLVGVLSKNITGSLRKVTLFMNFLLDPLRKVPSQGTSTKQCCRIEPKQNTKKIGKK